MDYIYLCTCVDFGTNSYLVISVQSVLMFHNQGLTEVMGKY